MPHVVAVLAVLLIGVLKEWYDYKHPQTHTADWFDFIADVIGVVAALTVSLLLLKD